MFSIPDLSKSEIEEAIEFLNYSNKVSRAEWKEKLIEWLENLFVYVTFYGG